ncbi:phage portal protein [Nocardia brasiliensis]|uniref:phage portal protein n=1 Tax=Nocardia brasiliensis TaxID=37326 RepID=UPI0024585E14|nr:phage portal protein [Nocardia brasiliensis]
MPDFSGKWPPKPHDDAYKAFDTFDAWWSGDTEALQTIYSDPNYVPPRPSQLMGGVRGKLARFWWGRPMLQDMKRLHVPAAADVATTSADLLFGQPPSWLFNEGDAADLEAAQERLNDLMDGAETVAALLEGAEVQAALGGVYLRLWWDKSATDKVMLSPVAPDAAIPQWRYGRLAGVTFWSVVEKNDRGTWRHLEYHEPGRIEHALFCGDDGSIGRRMPLNELKATEWAADLVDENSTIATGVDGLTACYVPNVRPARRWRNVPQLSPMGRSDFEGVEPLFDALDEAWSSWMRDLDLAKGRLFVSQEALQDNGPGAGATFDLEQAIFTPVPGNHLLPEDGPNQMVQAQQFQIRVDEHAKTVEKLLKQILRACGYSAGDFDDSDAAAMTATEVSARKDKSNTTRARKILYYQAELPALARVMLQLDQIVYRRPDCGIKADPEMRFPVRVDQDPVQLSTAISNLYAAKAISTETRVRMFHPNWSNEEVDEEVDRILSEDQLVEAVPQDPAARAAEEPRSDLHANVTEAAADPAADLTDPQKAA